jgi:hypothetical protein
MNNSCIFKFYIILTQIQRNISEMYLLPCSTLKVERHLMSGSNRERSLHKLRQLLDTLSVYEYVHTLVFVYKITNNSSSQVI